MGYSTQPHHLDVTLKRIAYIKYRDDGSQPSKTAALAYLWPTTPLQTFNPKKEETLKLKGCTNARFG
jgi:hypothetical protein